MNSFFDRLKAFYKSRLFILLVGIVVLFLTLVGRLFYLQIVNGEEHLQNLKTTITRKLTIPASRGSVYDRYGRPLATNQVAFSVKIDDSIKADVDGKNELLFSLVNYLESQGNPVEDTLPITKSKPYSFSFQGDKNLEKQWKQSIGFSKKQMKLNAEETLDFLVNKFEIPLSTTDKMKRKIISLGVNVSDKNLMLLSLIQILEQNGETIIDDLPISNTQPYIFLFDGNQSKEAQWKKDVSMRENQYQYTAEQSMEYLVEFFGIPKNLSNDTKRKAVSLKYTLYLNRYRKYQPITVALDISDKTVAAFEEKQSSFPGITIDTDSLRNYNHGEYFSHILGYIRKISDTEYEEFKQYKKVGDEIVLDTDNKIEGQQIYTNSDIIGKSGIEKVKELELNGNDGEMLVEVDSIGRPISTVETKQPISGKDVFLTIDEQLQVAAYNYLEESLRDVLISKLTAYSSKQSPISLKQLFSSMLSSNNIPIEKIYASTEGEQNSLYHFINSQSPNLDISKKEDKEQAKQILIDGIDNGAISTRQMVLVLYEQGKITADENYLNRIKSGNISPLSVVIEKLKSGELRPSDTNLDPCTGSLMVSDVNTGEVLALVTYPSYDNNKLVNNFNNAYYNSLLNDPTTPLVNRALSQKKAPGSTFKMITALAGLETGAITPNTLIKDLGSFTKTGIPYAKCWIYSNGHATHGSINVSTALEVSCNYFFYELAYSMGNVNTGNRLNSIETLKEYMTAFGLNDVTGIEIGESVPNMASPEYKEEVMKWQNPEATTSQTRWTDGDTIRAAIGQSVNNFAPSHMTKYIATLANGGTRYKMHLIDKVTNPDGTILEKQEPVVENVLQLDPKNIEAVHKGMLLVTQGAKGTLRTIFKDFPIDVATKSGTAQEDKNRSSHSWFVGFAPYDNPQIAVTVMIPFGEVAGSPTAVVAKNIIAEYMGLNYKPENTYMENVLAQ